MTNQTKTNSLNYLFDLNFGKINRLFVLSFENEEDRTSFSKYFTLIFETEEFNVLIDGKSFFDVPIKKEETKAMIAQLLIYSIIVLFQSFKA